MRLSVGIATLLAMSISGCAATIDFVGNSFFLPNEGVRGAQYSVSTERDGILDTSDGVALVADVHRPVGLTKTPTILVRIPFTNTFGNRVRSDMIGRYWASRGYTVVLQGTRGRYRSEGKYYPLVAERRDGLETLEWLQRQRWYDGRVAMWGGSAFGHSQWAIADQHSLSALFIQIASTDFRQMFYPGGAFSLETAVYWAIRSRGERDRQVDEEQLVAGVNTLPIIEADDAAIGDTDFYNDWVLNRENEDYWQGIDGHDRTKTISAPVLLMAGWFDPFLPSQLKDFERIARDAERSVASETRLIVGPWAHAVSVELPNTKKRYVYRKASIAPSIPWFDSQLDMDGRAARLPRVQLFVMGTNMWREEHEWPLERAVYTPFYLEANGVLGRSIPQRDATVDRFIYDPDHPVPSAGGAMLGFRAGIRDQTHIEKRGDVLTYSTPPLSEPLEVTGPVRAVLYVRTSAVATDFTAKLVDVYPDGSAYNLCDGIIRRGYEINSQEPTRIEIELWPTSNVFLKGHQIRVEISSSNFPRYDRNLNTGNDPATSTRGISAHQTIFRSSEYPSQVILPLIHY